MTTPDGFVLDSPAFALGGEFSKCKPYTVSYCVGPSDLGATIAHVSNVRYVHWIDRAAELHWDSIGCTRSELLRQGRMWFVAHHAIDYLAESFLGDSLGMATWIARPGRTSLMRHTIIWNKTTGTHICRSACRWAMVELATRRPMRIPLLELSGLQELTD